MSCLVVSYVVIMTQFLTGTSQTVPLKPTQLFQFCDNKIGNFTINTTYASNVNRLLSSFPSLPLHHNGFYNVSFGESHKVNSVLMCRGDIEPVDCIACLSAAGKRLNQLCPVQKEAIIWYDRCMVRYSNRTIFNKLEIYPRGNSSNAANFTGDADVWEKALRGLLESLRDRASAGGELKKFSVGETSAPLFKTLYGLVQCTPDISEADCAYCLTQDISYIPKCCDMRIGAYVLSPSCMFAYGSFRFYDPSVALETPSMAPPVVQPGKKNGDGFRTVIITVASVVALALLIACIIVVCLKLRKSKLKQKHENGIISTDSVQFDFSIIRDATDNFSSENKLGEGGFGQVYKGVLSDGQQVAVKRLSNNTQQGEREFEKEVMLVAKLHHRNLVRLLGFSADATERLLIYEFLPKTSLDHFIFDPIKRQELEWEKRYRIIQGIARGLLYLHQDSRLRIIHGDLKASNILLDDEMNPKIADFGTARLFDIDHTTQRYTRRIVGTFGYMAPEYAMLGQVSLKTDVYSFGVLVLEIISGQRNNGFSNGEGMDDLLSYAWKNWKEGKAMNVVDSSLRKRNINGEMMMMMRRCINIGLLCVQEKVAERPNMAKVVVMLSTTTLTLSTPSHPSSSSFSFRMTD